jgi:hypothetical protein
MVSAMRLAANREVKSLADGLYQMGPGKPGWLERTPSVIDTEPEPPGKVTGGWQPPAGLAGAAW